MAVALFFAGLVAVFGVCTYVALRVRERWDLEDRPHEAWVVFLDGDFREIGKRTPVVVNCDPLNYTIQAALSERATVVQWVRVIDANGNVHDTHISHATS